MKKIFGILLSVVLTSINSFGANRYWVGASNANWSATSSWATTSNGTPGASVPGSGDVAIFDANKNTNCTIDVSINVQGFSIQSGYTATITQSATVSVTVGSGNFSMASGVYAGSNTSNKSSDITINGAFSQTGGTFTSTRNNLTVFGNYTYSGGTFNHNSGFLVLKSATGFTTCSFSGNITLYDFKVEAVSGFNKTVTIGASNTITVNKDITITGANGVLLNGGNISVKGNVTTSHGSTSSSGTTNIQITGTGNQTINGNSLVNAALPLITVNKSSGTLTLTGSILIEGGWVWTAGSINASTSTVAFGRSGTITGSTTFNHLIFQGQSNGTPTFTISSGTILTCVNLSFENSTRTIQMTSGEIRPSGNISINTPSGTSEIVGTTIIRINGTGNQTISGNSPSTAWLPIIYIDKPSGNLTISGSFCIPNEWRYIRGNIVPGTSTVGFVKNAKIRGSNHSLNHVNFYSTSAGAAAISITDSTTLTVLGNINTGHFTGSTAIAFNNGTIDLKGDLLIGNNSHPSTNSTTIKITGTANQTIFGNGELKGSLPNIVIEKSSGTLYLSGIISVFGNWTYTSGTIDATTYNSTLFIPVKLISGISGNHTLKNLTIYRTGSGNSFFNIGNNSTITLLGDFTTQNTGLTSITGGTIEVNGNINITAMLDGGAGSLKLIGSGNQRIFGTTATNSGYLPNLIIAKPSGNATLARQVNIKGGLSLIDGILTSYNLDSLINFADNSSVTVSSDSSYISGPVRKIGNDGFVFPIGKNGKYRPVTISSPLNAQETFIAEYFDSPQSQGSSKESTIRTISNCEFWKIDRTVGASNVNISLSWNEGSCNIPYYLNDLRLCSWNGSQWTNKGYSTSSGNRTAGSFTANTVNSYGFFVIGEVQTSLREIVVHKRKPATLYLPESGEIDIEVIGGYLPLSYAWSNGQNTEDLDSLTSGSYSLTVTDAISGTLNKTAAVDVRATFVERINCQFDGVNLDNASLTTGWNLAGAVSDDVIKGGDPGWVQFVIDDKDDHIGFGLTNIDVDQSFNKLKYGLLLENRLLWVYMDSSGVTPFIARNQSNDTLFINNGDTVKIERTLLSGDNARYNFYVNGYKFFTRDQSDKSRQLFIDIAFRNTGARLRDIVGVFSSATLPIRACSSDDTKNHYTTTIYDENGNIIASTREYFNLLGQLVQTQSLDKENANVLASQIIYDQWGRPVIQTLHAPIYRQNIDCYASHFVRNDKGEPYSVSDFDREGTIAELKGEVNNPFGVNNAIKGSLGWYYSNRNNTELYVAASSYPYFRTDFHRDLSGGVKTTAAPGEMLKMGTGNSAYQYSITYGNELVNIAPEHDGKIFLKKIVRDSEGEEFLTWSDLWGNIIATGRSNMNSGQSQCTYQNATTILSSKGTRSADIHIPQSGKTSLKIKTTAAAFLTGSYWGCPSSNFIESINDWNLKIVDLESNLVLIENIDYSLSAISRGYLVTFLGQYASGSNYFRISFEYSDIYKCVFYNRFSIPAIPPDLLLTYQLDYSHFTLHKYNTRGLLTDVYSPMAIDCQSYNPAILPDQYTLEHQAVLFYQHSNTTFYLNQPLSVYTTYKTCQTCTTATHSRNLNVRLSNYAQIIQVDPNDIGIACDFGDAALDFVQYPLEENITNHGGGIVLTEVAFDSRLNTISRMPALVKPNAITDINAKRLLIGNRAPVVDMSEIDPDYCEGISHCYDGVTNCGETSADVGSNCPSLPCSDSPPVLVATYKYIYSLRGFNGTTESIYDIQGNVDNNAKYTFFAHLYKTCTCEYFWDATQFSEFTWSIPESVLNSIGGSGNLRFVLEQIEVKKEPQLNFANFNSSDPVHKLARYIGYKSDYYLFTSPLIPAPTHNSNGAYADKYFYNEKNELDRTEFGDEGTRQIVYDKFGRIRFSRTSVQAQSQQFSYVKYDKAGRTIETGVYTSNSGGGNIYEFLEDVGQAPSSGYTSVHSIVNDNSLPLIGSCTDVSQVYYDGGISLPGGFSSYQQGFTNGRMVKTQNGESSTWYGYDMYGRLVWSIQYINDLNKYFTHNYEFDYLGNLTKISYQKEQSNEAFYHYYFYDQNQRLNLVKTNTIDDIATAVLESANMYYLHGALKRTEIGYQIQGLDYVYTINGFLKSINAPELTNRDPGKDSYTNSFAKDVFGMTLDYFNGDYKRANTHIQTMDLSGGSSDGKHDGSIRYQRWKVADPTGNSSFTGQQVMYAYQYDRNNQITGSTFYTVTGQGTQNGLADPFGVNYFGPTGSVQTAYSENSLTYDKNGNILTLQRKNQTGTTIDNLIYNYSSNSNKLNYISDAVGDGVANYDVDNQSSGNYLYDADGKMTRDVKKDVNLAYNHLGLVTEVRQHSTNHLIYVVQYDEQGRRISKADYSSGVLQSTTWYSRDASGSISAVYKLPNGGSLSQEEVVLKGSGQLGSYYRSGNSRRYQISDHLGNVRALVLDTKLDGDAQIVEASDYYPFGALLPGRHLVGNPDYRLGLFGEEDLTVNNQKWITFELRNYDPNIGRWLSPDPYRQYYSPYLAMNNNPANFVDPTGGWADYSYNHAMDGADPIDRLFGYIAPYVFSRWNSNHFRLLMTYGFFDFGEVILRGATRSEKGSWWVDFNYNEGETFEENVQYLMNRGEKRESAELFLNQNGIGFTGVRASTINISELYYQNKLNFIAFGNDFLTFNSRRISGEMEAQYESDLDNAQLILTGFSLVPGINILAMVANGLISVYRGNYIDAAFCFGGAGFTAIASRTSQTLTFSSRVNSSKNLTTLAEGNGLGTTSNFAAKGGANLVEQTVVHGNSLKSLKPTWGYKLYSADGTFLKNGITSAVKAESRYTKSFMSDKYMEKVLFPNRKAAYDWEFLQNQILKGPLNKNMH